MWEYRAQVKEVLDGDTLRLLVDVGFFARMQIDLRLAGVMAPEEDEPGGSETLNFVETWVGEHIYSEVLDWPALVRTQVTKVAEPQEKRTFTRYIGTLSNIATGAELNIAIKQFLLSHPEWGGGIGST